MNKKITNFVVGSAAALLACHAGQAPAEYPDRQVHLILGFAAGGGIDTVTRLIAKGLQEKWGQTVIVENRPGGDATIAHNLVAHAKPDGYTLLIANNSLTNSSENYKLDYDPVKSFEPITLTSYVPELFLVNPATVPVKSIDEFISIAKSKPNQLNFGSSGPSSPPFFNMAEVMQHYGISMVNVTYNGNAPSFVALMGGEIQSMFGSVSSAVENIKAGKVRALAVSGNIRVPALRDVPTFAEMGVGIDSAWNGILAPAGTPKDIIAKLHTDITDVLKLPESQKAMENSGFIAVGSSTDDYAKLIVHDIATQAQVLKALKAH